MLSTANNKTRRMIQERVQISRHPFSINFLLKSLQNFTIMFKNIQFIKSDVDKQ